jgi:hypothetical protein
MGLMPKIAVTVGLSYAWAAYDTASRRGKWQGFAAGGALMVAIIPFTIIFMKSTNQALIGVATEAATMSGEQVAGLIKTWSSFNIVRATLPLVGAVVGSLTLWSNIA